MEERSSPDFLFVRLNGAVQLSTSDYYGSLSFDSIRVWASVHSGSTVKIDSMFRHFLWAAFHKSALFTTVIETVGPIGFFVLVLLTIIGTIQLIDFIQINLISRIRKGTHNGRLKRKKA